MAKETAKDRNRIAKIGAYGAVAAAILAALITGIFAVLKPDKSPAQTVNNRRGTPRGSGPAGRPMRVRTTATAARPKRHPAHPACPRGPAS